MQVRVTTAPLPMPTSAGTAAAAVRGRGGGGGGAAAVRPSHLGVQLLLRGRVEAREAAHLSLPLPLSLHPQAPTTAKSQRKARVASEGHRRHSRHPSGCRRRPPTDRCAARARDRIFAARGSRRRRRGGGGGKAFFIGFLEGKEAKRGRESEEASKQSEERWWSRGSRPTNTRLCGFRLPSSPRLVRGRGGASRSLLRRLSHDVVVVFAGLAVRPGLSLPTPAWGFRCNQWVVISLNTFYGS